MKVMEGRRSQVILLDERKLEILIQPKLFAGDLLAIVASHFNLKEKEYFGLAYLDDNGHYNWLHLDHYVLDHEFPKKSNSSLLTLYFLVKYYVECVTLLRDSVTYEQFYLQTKSLIHRGQIEVEPETACELAAHALQATHGDYSNDECADSNLKKLSILPPTIVNDRLLSCEEKVIDCYKKLMGQSRGLSIINFLSIVEKLPTYGIHYYDVKDKNGVRLWLGISHKGIAVYDHSNKRNPKKVYQWKQLENLYFRDRKFSVEVHDSKRVSVSRRTFGPGNVVVVVWFAATSNLTKYIWAMAISQHQFHLDKKQSTISASSEHKLSEIAADLSASKGSLSTTSSNMSRCESSQSLDSGQLTQWNGGQTSEETTEESEKAKAERREYLALLKAKKDTLQQKLKEKTDELKLLCLKEGGIIGELPADTPLAPGEARPQVRRRMGTAFTFPENLINKLKSKECEELANLELEYEIQSKITSAAFKLANDTTTKRSARKQRIICYKQSQAKMKSLELKLAAARSTFNQKMAARGQIKKKQPRPSVTSTDETDFVNAMDGISLSPATTPVTPSTPSSCKSSKISDVLPDESNVHPTSDPKLLAELPQSLGSSCTSISRSSPSTPTSDSRLIIQPCMRNVSPSRLSAGGYIPNSVYQTKSSYRNQHYPTFSTKSRSQSDFDKLSSRSSSISGKFSPAFHNKCDGPMLIETRGLYNVPMQRTSQAFYSQDELDELREIQNCHSSDSSRNSFRRSSRYQPSPQNQFGSLDRAFSSSAAYNARIESRSMDNLDYPENDQVFENETDYKDSVPEVSHESIKPVIADQTLNNLPFRKESPFPILRYDCSPRRQEKIGANYGSQRHEASPQIPRHKPVRWQTNESHCDYPIRNLNLSHQSLLRTVESTVILPHQPSHSLSHQSLNLSSASEQSPKAKEKEWYETCVDSPLPPRKQSLSYSDASPKSPSTSLSNADSISSPSNQHFPDNLSFSSHPSYENVEVLQQSSTLSVCDNESGNGSVFLPVSFQPQRNCTVVSMGQFQPYREETKPYETSDFYKYSTKFRKQQHQVNSPTDNKLNRSGSKSVTEIALDVANSRIPRGNLTVDTQESSKYGFQVPNGDYAQLLSSPKKSLIARDVHSPNRARGGQPPNINQQLQYLYTGTDCIGPDESYNPRFEMPCLPSPRQLQGIYEPPKAMTCEPICRNDINPPVASPSPNRYFN
ncbi:FERM domain-containing protein 4A, variant 3 [Chamberlinius hualienensis]